MQSAGVMPKLLALILVAAVCVCVSSGASLEKICQLRCLSGHGGGNLCNCASPPFQGKRSDLLAGADTWNLELRDPNVAPTYPRATHDHPGVMYGRRKDADLQEDRRRFLNKIFRMGF